MESVGQSHEPLRERSVIGGWGTSEPGDVDPEAVLPTIGRRALLGIGVAAGAFAIGGAHVADADADVGHAAAIQGVTLSALLTAPPGLTSITKDYASFIPYGGSKIVSSYMGASGATTTNVATGGGGVGFDLPAGSQIHKIELTLHSPVALSASSLDSTAYISQAGGPSQIFGSFLGAGGPGLFNRTLTPTTPRVLAVGEALSVISFLDTRAFISATVHYLPPTAGLVPITPKRVYDSRAGARIVLDETRVISVATGTDGSPNVIPPGARAIAYNITITDTVTGFGYLTVVPGGAPTGGPSSVNWDKVSATIANGLQVGLDSNRQVSVYCSGVPGAATHFIIDVVGYFL